MIYNDMIEKPIIIDDVIDVSYQNVLIEEFIQKAPWFFVNDITFANGANHRKTPAFSHLFTEFGKYHDDQFFHMVSPIAYEACKHINYKIDLVYKARSFLQLPLSEQFKSKDVDALHVDQPFPHLVVLYYLVDSDGDTILVDHKREDDVDYNLEAQDFKELLRITPKKGRCVIFDGDYYHTAEQPVYNTRAIINFNLLGKFKDV
jgi:hypothetical protein